jgi:hypothetical protein
LLAGGRPHWGLYHLVGLAHFLLAALMPLRRDLAPLLYGVFVAVCVAYAKRYRLSEPPGPLTRPR